MKYTAKKVIPYIGAGLLAATLLGAEMCAKHYLTNFPSIDQEEVKTHNIDTMNNTNFKIQK